VNHLWVLDHLSRVRWLWSLSVACHLRSETVFKSRVINRYDTAAQFARHGNDLMDNEKTYHFRESATMSQPVQVAR
jgi:hypothetical protein